MYNGLFNIYMDHLMFLIHSVQIIGVRDVRNFINIKWLLGSVKLCYFIWWLPFMKTKFFKICKLLYEIFM